MTDGRAYWKKSLYGSRVGVHPNRPLLVDFGATTGGGGGGRRTAAKELEEAGLGYMTFNLEYWNDPWKSSFPDMTEIKKEEVSALPEFVRHFRCGDLFEKGDPLCGANKYTPVESSCKIPGRVSWHPGWYVTFLLTVICFHGMHASSYHIFPPPMIQEGACFTREYDGAFHDRIASCRIGGAWCCLK